MMAYGPVSITWCPRSYWMLTTLEKKRLAWAERAILTKHATKPTRPVP